MRPTLYIPNFNGAERLGPVLRALGEQTRPLDVVLVDNGSSDDSVELARREGPELAVVELGENLGFGGAIDRAVADRPGDPLILLNNDAVPEPRFVEALLDGLGAGVDSVAGVLVQERAPELIDSAGSAIMNAKWTNTLPDGISRKNPCSSAKSPSPATSVISKSASNAAWCSGASSRPAKKIARANRSSSRISVRIRSFSGCS